MMNAKSFWWSFSDNTIAVSSYIGVIMLFMALDYYVVGHSSYLTAHLLGH